MKSSDSPTAAARLSAVDHVEIEGPAACGERLRWFYGELIGLQQVDDAARVDEALLRFKSERLELRIRLIEAPVATTVHCRVHLEVRSLEELASALEDCKYDCEHIRGLQVTDRRLLLLDPAGNWLSLRRKW